MTKIIGLTAIRNIAELEAIGWRTLFDDDFQYNLHIISKNLTCVHPKYKAFILRRIDLLKRILVANPLGSIKSKINADELVSHMEDIINKLSITETGTTTVDVKKQTDLFEEFIVKQRLLVKQNAKAKASGGERHESVPFAPAITSSLSGPTIPLAVGAELSGFSEAQEADTKEPATARREDPTFGNDLVPPPAIVHSLIRRNNDQHVLEISEQIAKYAVGEKYNKPLITSLINHYSEYFRSDAPSPEKLSQILKKSKDPNVQLQMEQFLQNFIQTWNKKGSQVDLNQLAIENGDMTKSEIAAQSTLTPLVKKVSGVRYPSHSKSKSEENIMPELKGKTAVEICDEMLAMSADDLLLEQDLKQKLDQITSYFRASAVTSTETNVQVKMQLVCDKIRAVGTHGTRPYINADTLAKRMNGAYLGLSDSDLELPSWRSDPVAANVGMNIFPPTTSADFMETYVDPQIKANFKDIETQFEIAGVRRIRGDGNCYYRAVMYGLIEQIILEAEPHRAARFNALAESFTTLADDMLDGLKVNHRTMIARLREAADGSCWKTIQEFQQEVNTNPSLDIGIVMASRYAVAKFIRANVDVDFFERTEAEESLTLGEIIYLETNMDSSLMYANLNDASKTAALERYLNSAILMKGICVEGVPFNSGLLARSLGFKTNIIYFEVGAGKEVGDKRAIGTIQERVAGASVAMGEGNTPMLTVPILHEGKHFNLLYTKAVFDKLPVSQPVSEASPAHSITAGLSNPVRVGVSGGAVSGGAVRLANVLAKSEEEENLATAIKVSVALENRSHFVADNPLMEAGASASPQISAANLEKAKDNTADTKTLGTTEGEWFFPNPLSFPPDANGAADGTLVGQLHANVSSEVPGTTQALHPAPPSQAGAAAVARTEVLSGAEAQDGRQNGSTASTLAPSQLDGALHDTQELPNKTLLVSVSGLQLLSKAASYPAAVADATIATVTARPPATPQLVGGKSASIVEVFGASPAHLNQDPVRTQHVLRPQDNAGLSISSSKNEAIRTSPLVEEGAVGGNADASTRRENDESSRSSYGTMFSSLVPPSEISRLSPSLNSVDLDANGLGRRAEAEAPRIKAIQRHYGPKDEVDLIDLFNEDGGINNLPDQHHDLTKEMMTAFKNGSLKVLAPAGHKYTLSCTDEIPKATLTQGDLGEFSDTDVQKQLRIILTVMNMVDSILARGTEVNVTTTDPFLAEMILLYIQHLQTTLRGFTIVNHANRDTGSGSEGHHRSAIEIEVAILLKKYLETIKKETLEAAGWCVDGMKFRSEYPEFQEVDHLDDSLRSSSRSLGGGGG